MKFNTPKRRFCGGEKKMVSWRLPEELLERLGKEADKRQWTTTDLVMTVLDQYLQYSLAKKDS